MLRRGAVKAEKRVSREGGRLVGGMGDEQILYKCWSFGAMHDGYDGL